MLAVNFLLLAAVLFCIGVYGVIARRNAVLVLMSIELILNSVNLNLIAFALLHGNVDGQVFALLRDRGRRGRSRRRPRHGADDLPQPPFDLARRALRDEGLTMLAAEEASVQAGSSRTPGSSPLIPVIAFALIIAIGKRMPFKGAEIGIGVDGDLARPRHRQRRPVDPADQLRRRPRRGSRRLVSGIAGPSCHDEEGHGAEPFVEPVVRTWIWW